MITCPACGERIAPRPAETLRLGRLAADTGARRVYVDGEPHPWPQGKEFTLLVEFMRHPGQLLTYDYLLTVTDTWRTGHRSLQVYKSRLDKSLGNVLAIKTCFNEGYSATPR